MDHSEPSDVPYSPNMFLGGDFFAIIYSKPALVRPLQIFYLLPGLLYRQCSAHHIVFCTNTATNPSSARDIKRNPWNTYFWAQKRAAFASVNPFFRCVIYRLDDQNWQFYSFYLSGRHFLHIWSVISSRFLSTCQIVKSFWPSKWYLQFT